MHVNMFKLLMCLLVVVVDDVRSCCRLGCAAVWFTIYCDLYGRLAKSGNRTNFPACEDGFELDVYRRVNFAHFVRFFFWWPLTQSGPVNASCSDKLLRL